MGTSFRSPARMPASGKSMLWSSSVTSREILAPSSSHGSRSIFIPIVSLKYVELKTLWHSTTKLYGCGSEQEHSSGSCSGWIRAHMDVFLEGSPKSWNFRVAISTDAGLRDKPVVSDSCSAGPATSLLLLVELALAKSLPSVTDAQKQRPSEKIAKNFLADIFVVLISG
ncbi:unnamed protein product [Pseudo-nitzschia multistriata]|uniref:Uncharacterized protein n=1 Tax=Pseudo-nitzschia multistriata TaxID=183589 RepID=A0A448ZKR9_9STRA|nr:unnamed protein product [Pseudo-nitzschia multistriata]